MTLSESIWTPQWDTRQNSKPSANMQESLHQQDVSAQPITLNEKRDTAYTLAALEEELRYLECDLSQFMVAFTEEQVILLRLYSTENIYLRFYI
jgi:hypothetical protein